MTIYDFQTLIPVGKCKNIELNNMPCCAPTAIALCPLRVARPLLWEALIRNHIYRVKNSCAL